MSNYISSNHERLYARIEPNFGQAVPATSNMRLPVVKFSIQQQIEKTHRRDKTGTRTHIGLPSQLKRRTSFEIQTYMTSWDGSAQLPAHTSLFQGVLGGEPSFTSSRTIASGTGGKIMRFSSPHEYFIGDGVTYGDEIRFVEKITDSQTVQINQSFSKTPVVGDITGSTVSFRPAEELPSLSIYSYRDPQTALQRFLTGAVINQMSIAVNGDFQEFQFSGQAKDVIDHLSFESPVGSLLNYPNEPTVSEISPSIIPGHLGQAWIGNSSERFLTVTEAEILLDNQMELRDQEFGSMIHSSSFAGERNVSLRFSLFEKDDAATQALYSAARLQTPVSVMFQLGQKTGQLLGIWMKSVIPEVPELDDRDTRVQWRFRESRAIGMKNDEIFIALG